MTMTVDQQRIAELNRALDAPNEDRYARMTQNRALLAALEALEHFAPQGDKVETPYQRAAIQARATIVAARGNP